MKRKSDFTCFFDELRSQDPRRRLNSVCHLSDLAGALGPQKTRADLLPYLLQFIDDQEGIIMELLRQLQEFTSFIGGPEHQKLMLPLLVAFCKMDQKKIALKACETMVKIISGKPDLVIDVCRQMANLDMTVCKEVMVFIISAVIATVPTAEPALLDMYGVLIGNSVPAYVIVASKYLQKLLLGLKQKEQIEKMLEQIYSGKDQLCKIHALHALIDYCDINSSFTLNKIKLLASINSWRINIKLLQLVPYMAQKMKKVNLKTFIQPLVAKALNSAQPQLRAAAMLGLQCFAMNLKEDQLKAKLTPVINNAFNDEIDFVKIAFSENIVKLIKHLPQDYNQLVVFPAIMNCLKADNFQLSVGIMINFRLLRQRMALGTLNENIIKPLLLHFNSDNWRIKCRIIDILQSEVKSPIFQNEYFIDAIIKLCDDRIDAVRMKANRLLIQIICNNHGEWVENQLMPKLSLLSQNINYLRRQSMLQIIQDSYKSVSQNTKSHFSHLIEKYLEDKVPNVRAKALAVCKENNNLISRNSKKIIESIHEEKDSEIKELLKGLRS